MAYTQQEIDTLKAAAARGVLTVERNGEKVTYASLGDMRRQISIMEAEVTSTPAGAASVSYPRTSRGL